MVRSVGLKPSFFWVVGFAGFEDSIDLVEQLAHDGDDDLLGSFPVFLEPVGKGFEQRIVHSRCHGRHEEAAAKIGGSNLGDWSFGAS
jgi:hypothetical protein